MSRKYLTLQDDYSDLTVEASSDQIGFTIEFGARNLTFETSRKDAAKLRDFINEFLEEGSEGDNKRIIHEKSTGE